MSQRPPGEEKSTTTIKRRLAAISGDLEAIEESLALIEQDRAILAQSSERLAQSRIIEDVDGSREEILLGPILDATKLSLKLIQANSLELATSVDHLIDNYPDLRDQLEEISRQFNITLNTDIENRAISIVQVNRKFANLLADVLNRYSMDLEERNTRINELRDEIRNVQRNTSDRLEATRSRMIEENATIRNRLAEESTRALNRLATENTQLKNEYQKMRKEYNRLESALNALLREVRIKQMEDEDLETAVLDIPPLEESTEEVQTLHTISMAFIKLGNLGPEVVCTDIHPFIPPEQRDTINEWLMRNGAFYMTLVGQSDSYPSGLYGPLPVYGYQETLVYVYAFPAHDTSQVDPRSRSRTYVLACLFFPKAMEVAYDSYHLLSAGFQFLISETISITDITPDFTDESRELLVELLSHKAEERKTDTDILLRLEEARGSPISKMISARNIKQIHIFSENSQTQTEILGDLIEIVWNKMASFNAKKAMITLKDESQILGFTAEDTRPRILHRDSWKTADLHIVFIPTSSKPTQSVISNFSHLVDELTPEANVVLIIGQDSEPSAEKQDLIRKCVEHQRENKSWHILPTGPIIPSIKQALRKISPVQASNEPES